MKELLAKRAAAVTKLNNTRAKFMAAISGDVPTAEQAAEALTLEGEVASFQASLANVQKQIDVQEQIDADALLQEKAEAKADADRLQHEREKRLLDSKGGRISAWDVAGGSTEPKTRVPSIITARSHVPRNFTQGSVKERQERSYRFGMFCLGQLSEQVGGAYRNRDAERWLEANMTVHQSNNATGGHVLIPDEFLTDLIDLRERYGVARRLFKLQPMKSDSLIVPRRSGTLTAYFTGQGSAGTESNKTWNDVRLVAKDLMAISRWSAQLDADAAISIGDDLAREITEAFALKEDQCAFLGTGSQSYGGIVGVNSALNTTGTFGVLTQGTSNTWSAITLTDFHALLGKLPQYAGSMPEFVCHSAFYYNVMQKLEYASGGVTARELQDGNRGRPLFMGYPVNFSQVLLSATAVATITCLFGEFSKAAMFGNRQQESIAFSTSATVGGESTFERNQIAIRGVERFDINVHDVGSSTEAGPVVGLKTGA